MIKAVVGANWGDEGKGKITDMLAQEADVVVDCTPGTIGPQNLEMYKKAGVKAIYQGGEDHELTGLSFNAISNYDDSYGKDYTRVVSCNTTGLTRTSVSYTHLTLPTKLEV